jgi:hypothetical protein
MSGGVQAISWPLFGHAPAQFDTDFGCIAILVFSDTERGSAGTTSGSKRQRYIVPPPSAHAFSPSK